MKYNEAYDKIIQAYFRDEIKPWSANFCFCGTLCDNTKEWYGCALIRHNDSHGYNGKDFVRMEAALLETLYAHQVFDKTSENFETALFSGMCAALDVLKQIHIERGEVIDETPVFVKRELTPSPLTNF